MKTPRINIIKRRLRASGDSSKLISTIMSPNNVHTRTCFQIGTSTQSSPTSSEEASKLETGFWAKCWPSRNGTWFKLMARTVRAPRARTASNKTRRLFSNKERMINYKLYHYDYNCKHPPDDCFAKTTKK